MQKFSCATGYTSSDEISLIFNAANHPVEHDQDRKQNAVDKVHPYNGRMQKLASVTAGVASARFNYHLNNPQNQWQDAPIELQSRLKKSIAYFDSRVVPCPNDTVIMETVFWRSNFDAFRNAISQISFANYSNKVDQIITVGVTRDVCLAAD